jgi:hypothetical protein
MGGFYGLADAALPPAAQIVRQAAIAYSIKSAANRPADVAVVPELDERWPAMDPGRMAFAGDLFQTCQWPIGLQRRAEVALAAHVSEGLQKMVGERWQPRRD